MDGVTAFRDYDEAPLWRYDYDFAPEKPADPEYRQAFAALQTHWLAVWMPRPGSVH